MTWGVIAFACRRASSRAPERGRGRNRPPSMRPQRLFASAKRARGANLPNVSRVQKPGDMEPVDAGPPDSQSPERDLAGALHEVSNALTVVLGWLECAREEMPTAIDVAKKAVDIATMHAKLGRRVARRAIGAESDALEEEADLEALVRDVVTGVEREALRRRVVLVVSHDPSSRAKIARAAPSLFQVMTNLLLNAIALSPEGSIVNVETAPNGGD